MTQYKAGDIIFLTRQKEGKRLRKWISNQIAEFTQFERQPLDDVKVHAAIIYEFRNQLFVREMEKRGDEHMSLEAYFKLYGERMEILPHSTLIHATGKFNKTCRELHVKYDYMNTFIYQAIKSKTAKWIGRNTPLKRMCAEDTMRMFNLLLPIFKYVEQNNPNELYRKCKELTRYFK